MAKSQSKEVIFDAEQAGELALAAIRAALKKGFKVSVAVYNTDQKELAFLSQLGSRSIANQICCAKAKVSAATGRPTIEVRDMINAGTLSKSTLEVSMHLGAMYQGGMPIFIDGVLIGGIGVSNMTGEEDEIVARAALKEKSFD